MKIIVALLLLSVSAIAQTSTDDEFKRSAETAAKLYPVAASDTSQFYLWMDGIDKELGHRGHPLFQSPNKPLIIAYCAAWVLGVEAAAPLVPLNETDKAYFNDVTAEIQAQRDEARRKAEAAKKARRRPGTIAGAVAAGLSPEVFTPSTPSASDKLDAIQRQLQMQENQRQIDALQQRMKDNRITR